MGVGFCCPPRFRYGIMVDHDDDDDDEVHELHTDSLDDLPAVMTMMDVPVIAPYHGSHTFPCCRVVSRVGYCRIGLWTR